MFSNKKNHAHRDQQPGIQDEVLIGEESRYFEQAQNWNDDRVSRAEKTVSRQRWLIGALTCLCGGCMGALLLLLPLKRVEPFLVRVDNATGIVNTVVSLKNAKRDYSEETTRYFIKKYINLRENYARNDIERSFRQMAVMTHEPLRAPLKKAYAFATPGSMYQQFGEKGTREITIKSTSRLGTNVFQVRFFATEAMSGIEKIVHYVSTIEYEYQDTPRTEAARAVTPLGFTVTAYRRVQEAVQSAQR